MKIFFRAILLCIQRIQRDGLFKSASALTYQSFLAIVPFLAVLFGIAKGFGLETLLNQWLQKEFSDHKEVLDYLLQFSQTTLREAQGGIIAGVGVILLLFTAIRLLSSVEITLNSMWGITRGRNYVRKISDYLALLLTCPILLAISGSATLFITTQFVQLTQALSIPESAQNLLLETLRIVPFVTSSLLFTLLLFAVPCAPVRFRAAACAGIVAAVAFQFVQAWYILFQLRLTKVSAVYGSFAALPLFLVWIWISWIIFLLAGEILIFIQERGWRKNVLFAQNTEGSNIQTDIETLSLVQQSFLKGKPLVLSNLIEQHSGSIYDIVMSLRRLEDRGYLLQGISKSVSVTISPNQQGMEASIADFVLPDPTRIGGLTSELQERLSAWHNEIISSRSNLLISHIDRDKLRN